MIKINTHEDLELLKVDEKLVRLYGGEWKAYRFLCFHPRSKSYVIMLNDLTDNPERIWAADVFTCFYKDYTYKEILEYQKEYIDGELEYISKELKRREEQK